MPKPRKAENVNTTIKVSKFDAERLRSFKLIKGHKPDNKPIFETDLEILKRLLNHCEATVAKSGASSVQTS